ncbi:MAG: PIN domain-containing protein [Acidobacteria bacterium]|nr:MAG: PIN domain-containing protein [Acidobacteriota bacterium]
MIGLDTNILVRYIMQDDVEQSRIAADVLERLAPERTGYVSLVAMVELAWVLESVFQSSRQEIAAAIQRLLQMESVVVQNQREVFAAMECLKVGLASFPDALIAFVGAWAGCETTLTFDKAAERLPGFTLARSRPLA